MKTVVISQPMFFPWVGLFEQVRLADLFIHYVDVQLPRGRSFITRVQIRSSTGIRWLTIPVRHGGTQRIDDVKVDDSQGWKERHLKTLQHCYGKAPHFKDMMNLVEKVYAGDCRMLADINIRGTELIAAYFGLAPTFAPSTAYQAKGKSSERLFELMKAVGGTRYVTGHGARNYLDHDLFERDGIRVEYMSYEKRPYPQIHGEFTPFVSILDLIANCGVEGRSVLTSKTMPWKEFVT